MAGSNHADDLAAVSRAMVALHKEHVGRGPTRARSYFSGADTLICVLEDALLPYERKMVELGDADRVRDSRLNFQAATRDLFVAAVEGTLYRKVTAFASAVDPEHDVVFENFTFEPIGAEEAGDNLAPPPSESQ
jgi:uncharacterized protein YbcI